MQGFATAKLPLVAATVKGRWSSTVEALLVLRCFHQAAVTWFVAANRSNVSWPGLQQLVNQVSESCVWPQVPLIAYSSTLWTSGLALLMADIATYAV